MVEINLTQLLSDEECIKVLSRKKEKRCKGSISNLSLRCMLLNTTRNYGVLCAPPLLAPAPRGHFRFHVYNGPCPPKKLVLADL